MRWHLQSGVMKMSSPLLSFLQFNSDAIITAAYQHIILSLGAVLLGTIVSVPFGIWLSGQRQKIAQTFLSVTSTIQAIPSLAFLGLMLPLLGIGFKPAIFVLFLYSLLPILRNTYSGIKGIEPAYLEAGRGMGMNPRQLLFMVKLPLALPVIMAGIRISTVYIISWATLAALIGAGGFGDLIFTGIQTYDMNFILAGTIPAALLALVIGWLLSLVENKVTPRGLKV